MGKFKSVASIFTTPNHLMAPRTLFRVLPFVVGLLLWGPESTSGQTLPVDTTAVQVRLFPDAPVNRVDLTVRENGLGVKLPGGGAPVMKLQSGDSATLSMRENEVFVRRNGSGLYTISLELVPLGTKARWTLSRPDEPSRTYTGRLHLSARSARTTGLLLVNRVPLEDYVASVVAGEYGLDDRAGTRAMAVVARTYGLYSTKNDQSYDHTDGTRSQIYEGTDPITSQARRAAATTKGQVLTYDDRLIQAVYFSSSGGHTANNEDVWTAETAQPYLRGRSDPYDDASPHHRWKASVDRPALLRALTRNFDASVNGFLIDERASHGRVETMTIQLSDAGDESMSANNFRLAVNRNVQGDPLKSTWFDAQRRGDAYVFEGRGFGHGVGLSQWGAHEMAEEGHTYRDILHFYYEGVDIQRLDATSLAPPAEPVATSPPDAPQVDSTSGRIGW